MSAGFGSVYSAGLTKMGAGFSSMFSGSLGVSLGHLLPFYTGNLAMSLVTSLFTSKPKPQEQLIVQLEVAICLVVYKTPPRWNTKRMYGQTRVAGQFILDI